MDLSRRHFISNVAAAGAALALPRADAAAARPAVPGIAELPPWPYGKGSFADDTVLMFRGNPSHTFYGTGPIPDRLRLNWKFRTAEIRNVVHGEAVTWAGTGWTGTAAKLGNYVYFGSVGGYVYCLEAFTGRLVWSHRGGGMFKGSLCIFDNKLYIGNTDNLLRCIDAATGERIWTFDTGNDLDSSPCVVDGRLYIAGENGYARCIDPADGREIWRSFMGGIGPGSKLGSNGSETSPAIAGGDYYAANYDGELYCLDAATGRVKWKASTGDDTDASIVVAGDRVFAAAEENASHLYCFDRQTGRELWRYSANPYGYWSTPAVVDGHVYIGGDDGNLHCVDAGHGLPIWTFKTRDTVWSSPAVVDGRVIFGGRDGYLYMVDAQTGRLVWREAVDGRIISSPCVVGGFVWIGSATGWFYCFGP